MAKSEQKETGSRAPTRQMWRRSLLVLGVVCVFFFGGVIAKMAQLQLVQADSWQQLATAQQLSDSLIDPSRGTIYDAGGHILAESQLVWTIIMSPKNISDDKTRTFIADELSALLEIDRDTLYKRTTRTYSQYEEIKKKIERAEVEKFAAWVEENDMTGIFRVVEDYKRVYPYGSLLSKDRGCDERLQPGADHRPDGAAVCGEISGRRRQDQQVRQPRLRDRDERQNRRRAGDGHQGGF